MPLQHLQRAKTEEGEESDEGHVCKMVNITHCA